MLKTHILCNLLDADLNSKDAETIINILKLKKIFPIENWSNEFLLEYLHNFWDWEKSEYIKERLLKKNGLHKRYVLRRQKAIENYWMPYFSKQLKLQEITKTDLKKFILTFSKKIKPASAVGKNEVIHSGLLPLKYAYENEYIPYDITVGLQLFSEETPTRCILSKDTVTKLFENPWENPVAELANKLALISGLRSGEIQALQQCDFIGNHLSINHSWNYVDGLKVTKNKKSRTVFIPFSEILIQLRRLADSNPFTNDGSGYIFYATIQHKPQEGIAWLRELRKELKKIGLPVEEIKKITFHSWRHFFTTHMRRDGYLDDTLIQKITGHQTLEMLNHYSNHSLDTDETEILLNTKNVFSPFLNSGN